MEFLAIYRDFFTPEKLFVLLAIIAFIVKCFTREYVSLSVGIGALITAFAYVFFTKDIKIVITVFAVSTILFALLFQPYAIRKNDERRMREAREKNVPFLGKEATVVENIDNLNATGKVTIDGVEYIARSATGIVNLVGQTVHVVDHDGSILLVV